VKLAHLQVFSRAVEVSCKNPSFSDFLFTKKTKKPKKSTFQAFLKVFLEKL